MFKKEMKSTIMYAVSQDITGIATQKGYNGAPILKICTDSFHKLLPIQQWCNNLGYNNKILSNDNEEVEVLKEDPEFCLFVVFGEDTFTEDFYPLM